MRTYLLFYFILFNISLNAQDEIISISPYPFKVDQQITITLDLNKQGTCLGSKIPLNATKVYIHSGIGKTSNPWEFNKGNWGKDDGIGLMNPIGNAKFELKIIPSDYYGITENQKSEITDFAFVFRNELGNKEVKECINNNQSDFIRKVGFFQANLISPKENSTTIFKLNENVNISVNNTNSNANYVLKQNGIIIDTKNTDNYSFNQTINQNSDYELTITQNDVSFTKKFSYIINKEPILEKIPEGLKNGINYNQDQTKVTLVLNAPKKDFIYVSGTFNNWIPSEKYLMKKDINSDKFWLEINNLVPNDFYSFQYWVGDSTDLPLNSPNLVKTADPFSDLVLSPLDDNEIRKLNVFPNLPEYPKAQEREVSLIQTGNNSFRNFAWSDSTKNFVKPSKKDLIIYEVLVRDFDSNRTYQDLINKIDYFKNLNINAIELMPVMEFEGNLSWGYNTAFHTALDKRYGNPAKLKEFIDLCHKNGIAVILDIALNHIYGRSPLERMWMIDADNNGWADGISPENPYLNQKPKHSYNVGSDINHYTKETYDYVNQVVKYWIQEYKIDGFRWDLTKGFTNNCSENDENCTNKKQEDRIQKLKEYADIQWNENPYFYVIFEHLGTYEEEAEWANYKIKEGKGIMLWRKMTDAYADLLKGRNANLSGIADFSTDRFIGYAESHDEERILFKAIKESPSQVLNNKEKAFKRMAALGSVHNLVPGPKMIWHFAELGWDYSQFTNENGQNGGRLDTKPQTQWAENWQKDISRNQIYNEWAIQNELKIKEEVFEKGTASWDFSLQSRPKLTISTSLEKSEKLTYVTILTNFSEFNTQISAKLPYKGTWYNLINNKEIIINDVNQNIGLEPNEYIVLGNQKNTNIKEKEVIKEYDFDWKIESPVKNKNIKIFYNLKNSEDITFTIYSLNGKKLYSSKAFNNQRNLGIFADFPSGIYIIKLETEAGEQTRKIIIE